MTAMRRTPMVQVQISALRPDGGRDIKIVDVSVWMWPALIVGETWTDGVRDLPVALEQTVTADVAVRMARVLRLHWPCRLPNTYWKRVRCRRGEAL
jgi:hypothetical protein